MKKSHLNESIGAFMIICISVGLTLLFGETGALAMPLVFLIVLGIIGMKRDKWTGIWVLIMTLVWVGLYIITSVWN